METTLIQKTCDCGNTFETEASLYGRIFEETDCPYCAETQEEKFQERQQLEQEERDRAEAEQFKESIVSFERSLDALIPERLLATNTEDSRFNAGLWEAVSKWTPDAEKPWLGLVGEPGACKTRCAYLRLRTLAIDLMRKYRRKPKVVIVTGSEFKREVMNQFSKEKVDVPGVYATRVLPLSTIARRNLQDMREADLLFFDEIGEKIKATPTVIEELFALIDERHSANLITIWTCNEMPEQFAAAWPTQFACPIAGRIVESSIIIEV